MSSVKGASPAWLKRQRKLAREFKLTVQDIHNLYDLFSMVNWQDYQIIKLNNMDKWMEGFFEKIDKICFDELYKAAAKVKKKKVNKE